MEFENIRKIILMSGIALMIFGILLIVLKTDFWINDIPVAGLLILMGFVVFAISRWAR